MRSSYDDYVIMYEIIKHLLIMAKCPQFEATGRKHNIATNL